MNNVLFTLGDESYKIKPVQFNYGTTMPINEIRAEWEKKDDYSTKSVDEILSLNINERNRHPQFDEILETMETLNTIEKMLHVYIMGGSHISGKKQIDFTDEVKAVQTLQEWVKLANGLHKLIGAEKIEIPDRLILKVARETKPTLFAMPKNSKSKWYNDKESEIIFLSPYENNEKALKEKKKSKKCKVGKNRILKFLQNKEEVFTV